MDRPNPEIAVKALRTEELLVLISNGDLPSSQRNEVSDELDKRNVSLNNAYRRVY